MQNNYAQQQPIQQQNVQQKRVQARNNVNPPQQTTTTQAKPASTNNLPSV